MHKSKIALILLLLTGLLSTNAMAGGCPDDIVGPDNKDTRVKYFDKHFKLKKFKCARRGGAKYWELPHVSGKECAKPKVDGCNIGNNVFHFLSRDKDLMEPSCNAHDLCYATFGLSKEQCDNEFKANLQSTVNRLEGTFSVRIPYNAIVKDANVSYDKNQAWAKEHCK